MFLKMRCVLSNSVSCCLKTGLLKGLLLICEHFFVKTVRTKVKEEDGCWSVFGIAVCFAVIVPFRSVSV